MTPYGFAELQKATDGFQASGLMSVSGPLAMKLFVMNIRICRKSLLIFFRALRPGVGNCFRPRAILSLYFWLAGRISVKKAHIKLKNALRGPDVANGPFVDTSSFRLSQDTLIWSCMLRAEHFCTMD